MYIKPTEDMIANGMKAGWSKEESERGYAIFDFDGTGLLEIEAIGDVYDGFDIDDFVITDGDCAREAERSGFCKIIPVDELPQNMEYNGYSRRWYGWLDTPENRKNISEFFAEQNKDNVSMKINIPKEFERDVFGDEITKGRFADFWGRIETAVREDMENNGLCGMYELETVQMFQKAFENATIENAERAPDKMAPVAFAEAKDGTDRDRLYDELDLDEEER